MKPRLYLETTIPSYLTAWASRDLVVAGHQQITQEWWQRRRDDFDIHISQLVLDEAAAGDAEAAKARLAVLGAFTVLQLTDEARELTKLLLRAAALPPKSATDAAHIALAATSGMHFLMTWNCTHINNAAMLSRIEAVCDEAGYQCPVICTPEELMEG